VRGADAVGDDRHARRLAVLAPRVELGLLVGEERAGGRVGDRGDARLEQAPGGDRDRLRLAAGGGVESDADGLAQLALVHATRAPVEVGVAEVLALHVGDQIALVQVVELDRAQPRAQQAARVLGSQIAADGPMAHVALAQQPARHRHHPRGVRSPRALAG
jgi:hypothetical protein